MIPPNFTYYALELLDKKATITSKEWKVLNNFIYEKKEFIKLAEEILRKPRKEKL